MNTYAHLTNRELERYLDDVQEEAVVEEVRQRVRRGKIRFVDPAEVRELVKECNVYVDLDELQSLAGDLKSLVD